VDDRRGDNREPGAPLSDAYADPSFPVRECDYCHKPYQGPAVYCSIECAELAAGAHTLAKHEPALRHNGDENVDGEVEGRELDDGVEPDEPDDAEDYAEEGEPPENDLEA
jgi:hypothetical protein